MRRSLFLKYVVLFVGLVTGVLVINAALDLYFVYQDNRRASIEVQKEKAQAAAQRVESFVREIERQIGWVAHPQWARLPEEQRRFDYVRLQRQVPAIAELAYIDRDGREQLKVSRLSMDVMGSGLDRSKDPAFVQATANKVYFGPVYFHKESEPHMIMAVSHGRRGGVTVATVNLKLILEVIEAIRIGNEGYAYAVNKDGRLVAHPDISLVLRGTDMSRLPHVAAALKAGGDGVTPSDATNRNGVSVLSAHAAIPAVNWLVFVELPVAEAEKPVVDAGLRALALLVFGLLIAAAAGALLARRMVVPIRALQAGAQRMGGGELEHRLSIKTGDELEALAEQFNRSAAALEESYAGLEQKVEERTAELREKSRQLEVASQHKSQFLANMSHELRTPLNAIIGYTEMMADGLYGDVPEKAQGVLERVQSNGRHLLGLINDVLDLSKIEAGQLVLAIEEYSVTDMVATVMSATESLARTKSISLTSTVVPGLPTGHGDARRLTQVLLNLVGNAIKFTDQGGVEIGAVRVDDRFEISVTDTGPGIAPADQGKIFEEFQQVDNSSTRKKGGTGLGLSISRKIVELHGGRIAVASEVGKGSTFTISIPINAQSIKDAAQ
jgi:two-component system, NtrC family, sensor kinase